jgi:hypothetical protein
LFEALNTIYPESKWYEWKFYNQSIFQYLQNQSKHRNYLEWVGDELEVKKPEDWYHIDRNALFSICGDFLKIYYGSSLISALVANFPEVQWMPWRFEKVNKKYWEDISNQTAYLHWVENELCIKKPEDWCGFTLSQVAAYHGATLIQHSGSISMIRYNYI